MAPDAKPNVITPLMSNLFESVILDSDAADGVKIPFSPWFATPGSDISLLENYDPSTFRGTVVPLSKADSRYIANLKNDTLTFCAQAVTHDLAEIDYEWTYIPANAKTAKDIYHSNGDDIYLFAGTEDYFSGEMLDFTIVPTGNEGDYQWHALSPLSGDGWEDCGWAQDGVKYTEEYFAKYLEEVWSKGGVVTVDMAMTRSGKFFDKQFEFMKKVLKK